MNLQKSYSSTTTVGKRNDCFLSEVPNDSHLGASVGIAFQPDQRGSRERHWKGISKVIEVVCKAIAANQAKFLCDRVNMLLDKPIRHGASPQPGG